MDTRLRRGRFHLSAKKNKLLTDEIHVIKLSLRVCLGKTAWQVLLQ